MGNKTKIITFRLDDLLYKKCVQMALTRGEKDCRIIQMSEIIRCAIESYVK